MKEPVKKRYYPAISGIVMLLILLISCKKTDYPLLDPETAGDWTLFNTGTGLPSDQIRDMVLDNNNNLFVAFSGSGIGLYQSGSWSFYNTSNSGILSNSVTSLGVTNDGSLLVGTANGISRRDAYGTWTSYKDPAVTTMRINTVKVTSDNAIWLGTENAGFYINSGSGYSQLYATAYKNVNAIEQDSQNNVFLGTDNGILKWDGSAWSSYTTAQGLPLNDVTALFFDSKKRLWIGTNGGDNVAWMDLGGTLHYVSLMNGSAGTFIRDIFEDRRGYIWFATWYDGLIMYDGVVPHSYKVYNGFYENDVNCLATDGEGNMWFGLYSKGLVKYTLPIN